MRRILIGTAALAAACMHSRPTLQRSIQDGTLPARAALVPRPVLATLDGVSAWNGGFGSAVAFDRERDGFWVLTDRGPNVDGATGVKVFADPSFAPRIGFFRLRGDSLVLEHTILLRDASGRPLTGLPRPAGPGATGETAADAAGHALPLDPGGVDTEGLHVLRDGSFWVADEYGPTLLHFGADGRLVRSLAPGDACGLPAVLARRRANRGIEGLTGNADGTVLVASLEAPLDNPREAGRSSRLVRIVRLDLRACTSRQLVYVLENPGTVVSDVVMLDAGDLLVLESDRKFPGAPADSSTIKRVYRVSLAGATDVGDAGDAAGRRFGARTLEQVPADSLAAARITPASKTLVADLLPLGFPHDKAEGLAILDRATLVITNDDDFGVAENGSGGVAAKRLPRTGAVDANEAWFVRLARPLW